MEHERRMLMLGRLQYVFHGYLSLRSVQNTDRKSKAILPYLILCPSTLTLISSCIIFVWGMAKLNYLNRDDVWLEDAIPFVFFSTVFSMEWKRIFVSLQMYLPISIWIASAVSAAFHPFFRCAFPGTYRKAKEAKAAQREEARRKWEERRAKKRQGDAEAGTLGEQSEVGRLGGVVGGVTEESPLMGTGGGAPEISGLPPSGA